MDIIYMYRYYIYSTIMKLSEEVLNKGFEKLKLAKKFNRFVD